LNIQGAPNSRVTWSLGECLHRGWRIRFNIKELL